MAVFGAVGALVAGAYGVVHDQITFRVGAEYFTRFKVFQFDMVDSPLPIQWVVAKIGFLASWWVGFLAGWFMGRLTLPHVPVATSVKLALRGMAGMLGVTLVFGAGGWCVAGWALDEARVEVWRIALAGFDVADVVSFAKVGYIHNGSYLGALLGLAGALVWIRLQVRRLV
jgi:hypothetical protein